MKHLLYRLDAASKIRKDDPDRLKWPHELIKDMLTELTEKNAYIAELEAKCHTEEPAQCVDKPKILPRWLRRLWI